MEQGGNKIKLSILPIGKVDKDIVRMLETRLSFLPLEISVLDEAPIPKGAHNKKRNQYDSSHFLILARKRPGDKVLGIAEKDLYSEDLNFVFGQAEIYGKAAVISLARLKGIQRLYESRVMKEAVHELGHTFGLKHCSDISCVMHFSNSLEDTDLKGEMYCKKCEGKLRKNKIL
jgi:archaemetzincin